MTLHDAPSSPAYYEGEMLAGAMGPARLCFSDTLYLLSKNVLLTKARAAQLAGIAALCSTSGTSA